MSEGNTNEIIGKWELKHKLLHIFVGMLVFFPTLVCIELVAVNLPKMSDVLETLPKYSLG